MTDIIIGTAGHIDHGKTSLVKALTGVDADRFPEEKKRGITIDIGFAELELGSVRIGFVDVPGHEKFVKNMLAGASGIDAVLLVVAADEGVMPQTREHFEICRLLGTASGLIVLTKSDLADDELTELVTADVRELVEGSFLADAPIVAVSSKSGEGVEDLKTRLAQLAGEVGEREDELIARLPIDRSFSVKGFGAVVTGTLVSGEITEGAEMEILPSGNSVRIRGLQTHGTQVNVARAGRRTAVNLGGIDHAEIERGMVLAERNILRPTQSVDCEVEVLKDVPQPLRSRQRVRVHIGTVEALARLRVLNDSGEIGPGGRDFVQLRLESPIVCIPGERFIIRFYSPQITIAGGAILDNAAERHRRASFDASRTQLAKMASGDNLARIKEYLAIAGEHGLSFADIAARTGLRRDELIKVLKPGIDSRSIITADQSYVSRTPFDGLRSRALAAIGDFHRREPLSKGIPRETLKEKLFARISPDIFRAVLDSLVREKKIVADKEIIRSAEHRLELSADEELARERLTAIYRSAGFEVPKLEAALEEAARGTGVAPAQVRKIFQLLINAGEIVKVTEDFYFGSKVIAELIDKMRNYASRSTDRLIDVAQFKDLAGVSRKYAIPLLEYFDRERITRRSGDKRLIV